ncbi:DNA integrity scanning diadenylate cyclase DisA [Shimazuella soli]|uniref:DNA integrity scanning diadenylate cyclase DisA n=1 Tax=Shimazuella soli TaxID=1892854 RepID=UPI002103ADFA|nr:DNA integrity scanning diadenylate cyclase DisA [Shimazuella soli]
MREEKTAHIDDMLTLIAPGTAFREGLDNILGAKTGALIVMGYDNAVADIVDGGFHIDCPFSSAFLYELAKMDGAIILSNDGKRILYANAQLVPSATLPSTETGIRHRTAQRTARQTGKLVVSISQRRNTITLYRGTVRYSLKDIRVILTKANQAVQTLEKYKSVLDQATTNLSALEFEELVTLDEVTNVLQRMEMVLRVKREIDSYIHELGIEGRLIRMQLDELMGNMEQEAYLLVKDYAIDQEQYHPKNVFGSLKQLTADELLDHQVVAKLLGYTGPLNLQEESVSAKGYRILGKIPRIPNTVIQKLVERFEVLPQIILATMEELDEVEGIGAVRAKAVQDGLKRIRSQVFIDRHL